MVYNSGILVVLVWYWCICIVWYRVLYGRQEKGPDFDTFDDFFESFEKTYEGKEMMDKGVFDDFD